MQTKMTTYTIERIDSEEKYTSEIRDYFFEVAPVISKMFGDKYDWGNFKIGYLISKGLVLICRRNGKITGHMIASLSPSIFDHNIKILQQISFYVRPKSGRTAYHLFNNFIDIGKVEAHHIITMLTSQTNIKPSSLKKLGFDELETLYRMET